MSPARHTDQYAEWGGHILFLALLGVGLGQVLSGSAPVAFGGTALVLGGAAAVAAWYVYGAVTIALDRRDRAPRWVVALTVLWIGLVLLSPAFVWLAFVLAMLCWRFLPLPFAVVAEIVVAGTSISATLMHTPQTGVGGVVGPVIGIATAAAVTEVYGRVSVMVDERDALVADLLATRQRLAQQQRQAGVLAERERLGGEIHDGTGQSLASIILLLRSATSPETPADRREVQVATALETAQAALVESRRFLRGLDSPELDSDGLIEALRAEVARSTDAGLPAEFRLDGTPVPLPRDAGTTLLRVAQEALTNAGKHSGADRAVVTLTHLPGEVHLDVADNGAGFDPARPTPSEATGAGFGLRAMRRRVSECGGSVSVESQPGDGTIVHARIPIEVPD
ncbi:sensor histidine kinase [Gordonia sp. (in: high G+C Gram-positive bacteria)]|uniref:sensor histidine kinase n=1 Tax=Gordonia sp. (in: high G+C Gram-positive bacteria) TaxID=84139 RepID=UPI003C726613